MARVMDHSKRGVIEIEVPREEGANLPFTPLLLPGLYSKPLPYITASGCAFNSVPNEQSSVEGAIFLLRLPPSVNRGKHCLLNEMARG